MTWPMTSRDLERWRSWPQYVSQVHSLENCWRYKLGYNGAPTGNGTWGIKWSHDRWHHMTLTGQGEGRGPDANTLKSVRESNVCGLCVTMICIIKLLGTVTLAYILQLTQVPNLIYSVCFVPCNKNVNHRCSKHRSFINFWHATLEMHSTKHRHHSSELTIFEPCQLFHSGRGDWISVSDDYRQHPHSMRTS